MISIVVKEVEPHTLLATCPTQYEMAATFMRIQEFYESPLDEIRGHYFTIEMFMDAYAKRHGNFTYTSDWWGFNMPGQVVKNFYSTFPQQDLLEKEKLLFERMNEVMPKWPYQEFCLIGAPQGKTEVIRHELAHARWALNANYKAAMDMPMAEYPPEYIERMRSWLKAKGYRAEVFEDETQAYLATDSEKEFIKAFGKKLGRKMHEAARQFRKTFKRFNVA